jgi:myo-inositol-1(or 4)-monophosphatase
MWQRSRALNGTELAGLADLCAETAREAGDAALAWRRERGDIEDAAVSTKSTPTDMVTDADRTAERLIRERLMTARPDAAWLGEETGRAAGGVAGSGGGSSAGSGAGGIEWVVDPIDGTTNFLYDLPGWAVSIAARVEGRTVAASVHIPTLGETCTAHLGGGASLASTTGRRPLAASSASDLSRALIATGFAYDEQVRAMQGPIVGALVSRVRDIRRAGAASVDFCAVAAGRVDAFFERDLEPWDLAAGTLIASEAGAQVYLRASGTSVAVAPGIADAFDALLTDLGD